MTSKAFIGLICYLVWHALVVTAAWAAYGQVFHDAFNWPELTWVNTLIVYAASIVLRSKFLVTDATAQREHSAEAA